MYSYFKKFRVRGINRLMEFIGIDMVVVSVVQSLFLRGIMYLVDMVKMCWLVS